MSAEPAYLAYLLRLWRVTDRRWRASLDDPHTGQRLVFGSLKHLLHYLETMTGGMSGPEQPDPASATPEPSPENPPENPPGPSF